jgi:hypothetical protein
MIIQDRAASSSEISLSVRREGTSKYISRFDVSGAVDILAMFKAQ